MQTLNLYLITFQGAISKHDLSQISSLPLLKEKGHFPAHSPPLLLAPCSCSLTQASFGTQSCGHSEPTEFSRGGEKLNKKQKNLILLLGQQVESVSPVKRQAPEPLVDGIAGKEKVAGTFWQLPIVNLTK